MAGRKPRLELYWSPNPQTDSLSNGGPHHVATWRLKAANGEVLCQCTQGFQDKTDAMRNVFATTEALSARAGALNLNLRIVGPGKKPQGDKA